MMNWGTLLTISGSLVTMLGDYVVPLLITIATVYFLWGVLNYIMAADDEKKMVEARYFIAYGLIGLFVIVAMWGLVNLAVSTFGVSVMMPTGPSI